MKPQVFNIVYKGKNILSEDIQDRAPLLSLSCLISMFLDFGQSKQEIIHLNSGKENTLRESKSNL